MNFIANYKNILLLAKIHANGFANKPPNKKMKYLLTKHNAEIINTNQETDLSVGLICWLCGLWRKE